MMGSGKTTVGRALAQRLGWKYLDSDRQVEATTGRTVPEILEQDGEAAFRAEETRALRAAIAGDEPVVVSVAGGAVLDPDNRAALSDAGTVVWLRADVDTLRTRVGDGRGRPLLAGDVEGNLRRLYDERRPIYSGLARRHCRRRRPEARSGRRCDPRGAGLITVSVPLGDRAYDVIVGAGARGAPGVDHPRRARPVPPSSRKPRYRSRSRPASSPAAS